MRFSCTCQTNFSTYPFIEGHLGVATQFVDDGAIVVLLIRVIIRVHANVTVDILFKVICFTLNPKCELKAFPNFWLIAL